MVLCLSLLVIGLDNTILNVALRSIADDLSATTSQLQWIVDGYTLVFAGLLLTSGSLGDRFGRRSALSAGLVIFAAGSIASVFATSAIHLILTRSVMGIGGSIDIDFGPEAPTGSAQNWIQTTPGKGWFTLFRFYGPLEPFFDQSWKPDDIVAIK